MLKIQKYLNRLLSNKDRERYQILKTLKNSQFFPRVEIEKNQISKLNMLLLHAYKNVPYYQNIFNKEGGSGKPYINIKSLDDIENIPFLTKQNVQDNYSQLCSKDSQSRGSYKNSTGGSTGEPIVVVQDQFFKENSQANFLLIQAWRNSDLFDSVIKVWGSEKDTYKGAKPLVSHVKDFFRNRLTLNSFKMNDEDMKKYIHLLNKHKPKLIISYAQSIYEIAKFAKENHIEVNKQNAIHTGAGNLYIDMRRVISDVFQCEVFDHYGTREVGSIASECQNHNGLHILMEHTLVEVVDELGKRCPPGVEGEIVITTLNNYSMPLIRYKIGDMGVMSNKIQCDCGCNYPMLQKISGRTNGIFKTKSGSKIGGEFFTHIFLYRESIKNFQVIQKDFDSIKVKIVKKNKVEFNMKDMSDIENKIKLAMGEKCRVDFEFVDKIKKTRNGKYLNTISEI